VLLFKKNTLSLQPITEFINQPQLWLSKYEYIIYYMSRLTSGFFKRDAVTVAEKLLGKILVRFWEDGTQRRYLISETEAYLGEVDLACHASKGRTKRTEVMYAEGGYVYVYLIYGMYWMLNVVTGNENDPQAVLIRGIDKIIGSGKVGRELKMDKSFYGENLLESDRIWIEDAPDVSDFTTATRIGIDYAGDLWRDKPWRFILLNTTT
jgi:DNA-3-methyladenine glycosylase